MNCDLATIDELLHCAARGDEQALETLLSRYRGQLIRMIQTRLNPQLRGRVDASDVVQEAHLDIARRFEEYARDPHAPFLLWVRSIVTQKLIDIHRRHLGAEIRDVSREVPLHADGLLAVNSGSLAGMIAGQPATPSRAAARKETRAQVQEVLSRMKPIDREVLAMRHFEQLSNAETARILGMSESGATARYLRALNRLKEHLSEFQSADQ